MNEWYTTGKRNQSRSTSKPNHYHIIGEVEKEIKRGGTGRKGGQKKGPRELYPIQGRKGGEKRIGKGKKMPLASSLLVDGQLRGSVQKSRREKKERGGGGFTERFPKRRV